MIAAWMVYAVLVAALLGAGALALELALRLAGREARWVWVLALAASLALPLLAVRQVPPEPAGQVSVVVAAARVVAAPVPDPSPALVSLDTAFIVGWAAASLVVLLVLLRTQWLLRREAAGGEPYDVDGHRVRITTKHGPAVVGGLRRATIVLPSWVNRLGGEARRLAVRHEAEHVATGDVRLLAVAALAAVVCPWNPAIWWQIRRLRDAVELDCDRRLVRAGVDVQAYGTLLLEVAHHTPLPTMAIALSARPSLLSRRIDHMTPTPSRMRGLRMLAGAGLGIALVILACEAPRPTAERQPNATSMAGPILDESQVDQPPILLSHPPMQYPPLLKDAGIQGKVELEFVIDTDGRVDASSITVVSSDRKEFERPAIDLVTDSRYRPGMNGGVAVPVRVKQPVSFSIVRKDASISTHPDVSQVDSAPSLLSHPPLQYPPLLRDAGVQGTVVLEFVVDATGRVDGSSIVVVSSDQKAFERPAVDLVKGSRFKPAMVNGVPTAVRIQQPVSFSIAGMERALTEQRAGESALPPVNAVAYPVAEVQTRLDSIRAAREALTTQYQAHRDSLRRIVERARPDSR